MRACSGGKWRRLQRFGFFIGLACAASASAQGIPTYRLDRAHLTYERQATATRDVEPPRHTTEQIEILSLDVHEGRHLLLLSVAQHAGGQIVPTHAAVIEIDAYGRRHVPEVARTQLGPLEPVLELLPVLPTGAQDFTAWRTPLDLYQRRWSCVNRGADARYGHHFRVDYSVEEATGIDAALGRERTGNYWFDPVGGRVVRLETTIADRALGTHVKSVSTLRAFTTHSPGWCRRRAEEAQAFLRALAQEERLLQQLVTEPTTRDAVQEQLQRVWLGFRSDVEDGVGSPFRVAADARRRHWRTATATLTARAELGQRWMGQPVIPWTLQDASGQTLISEARRRGVVIECFWSGESAWGLRALDSFQRLGRGLPPELFTQIHYNTDFDLPRAVEVIRLATRAQPHIVGAPLLDADPLPEVPLVRVLDRGGVIRGAWIGWDPDYAAARALAIKLSGWGGR